MLTRSVCPKCFKELAADIAIGNEVYMIKKCPEHGLWVGCVERDPDWYMMAMRNGSSCFYEGMVVNVTSECNISCAHCYHDHQGGHRTVDDIVKECADNADKGPFGLAGGEPTIHPDIVEIVKQVKDITPKDRYQEGLAGVSIGTNGVNLVENPSLLLSLCNAGLVTGDILNIGLSFHKESMGKDLELLEMLQMVGLKVRTTLALIDDLSEIDRYLEIYDKYRDTMMSLRIRAATNLWAGQDVKNKIFVSDMLRYLGTKGKYDFIRELNQKVSFANIMFGTMHLILVSWYDRFNVDLNDINCAPWFRGKDGVVRDLVSGLILNERY